MSEEIQAVTLNTINRTSNSTISEPIWYLSTPIRNAVGFKVKSLTLPLSIYNIDARNNKLKVTEGVTTYDVTIPPKNYTATQLITELKTQLDGTAGTNVYTITYDAQTNKITIASTGNFTIVSDCLNNIYYELGLASTDMDVSTNSLTPSFTIDLAGIKTLQIVCPSFQTNYQIDNFNVIASASIEERSSEIAFFRDDSDDYVSISDYQIGSVGLILYDERKRKLTIDKDFVITIFFKTE